MTTDAAIRLRPARAGDAARVAACVDRAYRPYIKTLGRPPGPMHDDYAHVIRGHAVTLALTPNEALAGLVVFKRGADHGLLDNVAVDPDFQGQGIGTRLIAHAERQARDAGYRCIVLYTQIAMTRNRARYARLGYEEYAQVREQGFDRVYLRKHLPNSTPGE